MHREEYYMKMKIKTSVSLVLTLCMWVQMFSFVCAADNDTSEANENVSNVSNGAVNMIYSDNFDTAVPIAGKRIGANTIEKSDDEHGNSLVFTSGSGSTSFINDNASDDSYMDIISFDIKSNGLERIYFDAINTDKSGNNQYYGIWYLTESGQTGPFMSYWSRGLNPSYVIKREPNKWYQFDLCIDYRDWTLYFYINGELIERRNFKRKNLTTKDYKMKFKGLRMTCENYAGSVTSCLDNVRYAQVVKEGLPLNLDKDINYVDNIENESMVEIDTKTIGSAFFSKDFEYDLKIPNVFNEDRVYTYKTKVTNEDGAVTFETEPTEVTVKANETLVIPIKAHTDRYGYGKITADFESKKTGWKKTIQKEYAAVMPAGETNPRFTLADASGGYENNINNYIGGERAAEKYTMFKQIGTDGFRAGSASISYSANSGGTFTPNPAWDFVAQEIAAQKMKQIQIAMGASANVTIENPPKTNAGIKAFANYWKSVADEYNKRGYNVDYEVWNEYNHIPFNKDAGTVSDYVNMLKEVYSAIKSVSPNSMVWGIGGVTTIANYYDWIEEFLKLGGAKYCDGLSVHPYQPGYKPKTAYETAVKTQELFDKYGVGDMPVYYSEFGYTSTGAVTERRQRNYSIIAATMMNDYYDLISWHTSQELCENTPGEIHFGWIRPESEEYSYGYEPYAPKPVFLAFGNYNRLTKDAKNSHKIENTASDDSVMMWQMDDRNGKKITLVWNDAEENKMTAFKVNSDYVRVCDINGNEYETKTNNGIFNCPVSADPIYIIGDYSEIKTTDFNVSVSEDVIDTALDDTFSLYVKNNSGTDADIEITTPENITLVDNKGFDENGNAKLTFKSGNNRYDSTKIRINVVADEGKTVLLNQGVELNYVDSVTSNIISRYFRSNRWKGVITLKNEKRESKVSGTLKITEPKFLAEKNGEMRFEDIMPQTSSEITFNIPENINANNVTVKAKIILDTGEEYDAFNEIYFSSFIKTKKPPVIDGKADEAEWRLDTPFVIKYQNQVVKIPDWGGTNDLSAEIHFNYDYDNLYMYAEIKDDVFYDTENENRIWFVDSIQFAFATRRTADSGRTEFSIGSLNGEPAFKREAYIGADTGILGLKDKENFAEDAPELVFNRDEEKKMTFYEMKMPWKYIFPETDGKPYMKKSLYFSMLVNDNDGNGRRGWLEFCPGIGLTKNPIDFKEISLK